MKFKLTKQERNWVLYDVGNSAFTLLVSTILPIYFSYLAEKEGLSSVNYLAYWGYGVSISTIIVLFLGPVFGTLADTKGFKKPIFLVSIALGSIACLAMGLTTQWLVFLIVFIIAKVGYNGSLIFYDSMLVDVTTEERMDRVSSAGYAWGYIGSCIPFLLSLVFVLGYDKMGISFEAGIVIAFFIVTAWWVLMSTPLLKQYRQVHYVERKAHAIRESFIRIGQTLKSVRKQKKIFLFLLAFFFYIDGVYTIIDMATAYGSALGLDTTGLLLALLVTQIVAFPFAILFGRLAVKYDTQKLILVCIAAYFCIAVFAMTMMHQWQFWVLAVTVGMFQGGVQALSRSYYTKIIPAAQSGEYFGLLDICGKGASFIGTTAVGIVSQMTGSINLGVGVIAVMFIIGIIFFVMDSRVKDSPA
ncbi:MAG: MFS transporter [Lachnospiraceae bacterium]|nr:MFS transporter [Lachnospiraceae bacterium]